MDIVFRQLGVVDYQPCFNAMKTFTQNRTEATTDECWLVQHKPVYTLGQAGKKEHILNAKTIPIIQSDRGGQVTYHGIGQWVFYLLFNLKRHNMGVRQFVTKMEQSVIQMLQAKGVQSNSLTDAPGVYVNGAKIAALGLRVKRGCSYHGISINVDTDLTPFNGINPCGYEGLEVINTTDLDATLTQTVIKTALKKQIMTQFNFNKAINNNDLPEAWHEC